MTACSILKPFIFFKKDDITDSVISSFLKLNKFFFSNFSDAIRNLDEKKIAKLIEYN